jgi:hypothetical protein
MRRKIIIVSGIVGLVALLVWWAVQPAPGVETKSGAEEMTAMVSLITAIVGLLTSVVTLVVTLIARWPRRHGPRAHYCGRPRLGSPA